MNAGDALHEAIIETPEDDGLRLIYADWREETGDTDRANFIRIQCAIARMQNACWEEIEHLVRKQEVLLDRHRKSWLRHLPNSKHIIYGFRRGFVESAILTCPQASRTIPTIVGRAPVQEITVRSNDACVPHFLRLEESYCDEIAEVLESLSASVKKRVRALCLHAQSPIIVQGLHAGAPWANLKHMDIDANIEAHHLEALCHRAWGFKESRYRLPALASLALPCNLIGGRNQKRENSVGPTIRILGVLLPIAFPSLALLNVSRNRLTRNDAEILLRANMPFAVETQGNHLPEKLAARLRLNRK